MATSKTEKAAANETAVFTVLSPLNFNNELIAVGDTVEMTAGQAASLIATGVVAKAK